MLQAALALVERNHLVERGKLRREQRVFAYDGVVEGLGQFFGTHGEYAVRALGALSPEGRVERRGKRALLQKLRLFVREARRAVDGGGSAGSALKQHGGLFGECRGRKHCAARRVALQVGVYAVGEERGEDDRIVVFLGLKQDIGGRPAGLGDVGERLFHAAHRPQI